MPRPFLSALSQDVQIRLKNLAARGDAVAAAISALIDTQLETTADYDEDTNVSEEGNDSAVGDDANPFRTFDRAIRALPSNNLKDASIQLGTGVFTWENPNIFLGKAVGNQASPPLIRGTMIDAGGGDFTVTGGSSSSSINCSGVSTRNGSLGGFVSGADDGLIRFEAGESYPVFFEDDVGNKIRIVDANDPKNNGTYTIAAYVDADTVDLVNAQGVIADSSNGSISWFESFFGRWVRFTSTTQTTSLRGRVRQLKEQSSMTAFPLSTALNTAPAAGDTFVIEKPGTVVEIGMSGVYVFDSGTLGVKDIEFRRPTGSTAVMTFRLVQSQLERVVFRNFDPLLVANFAVLPAGQSSAVAQWANSPNNPFSSLRTGAGVDLQDSSILLTYHTRAVGVWTQMNGTVTIQDHAVFSATHNGERVSIESNGTYSCSGKISRQREDSATDGIMLSGAGSSMVCTGAAMDFSNSAGYGIILKDGAQGVFGSVTGSNNVAAGIWVDYASRLSGDRDGTTAITGTAGDVQFGHPTTPVYKTNTALRTPDGDGWKGFADAYGNIAQY